MTDPSGAVIVDAQATATNADTGVQTSTRTNDAGLYSLLNLPVGRYSVTITQQGFKTYTREGITLLIGQVIRLDAQMQMEALAESVSVTTDPGLLPTDNTELGTHMPSRIVNDLPILIDGGRGLEGFAYAITPAVEGNSWTSYIGGSAAFSKEVLIDGTSIITQFGGFAAGSPSMEAVEEFKVETSGFRPEDSRTGGGVFKFNLKSGTNQFHGSAFGFMRNEAFNANTWNNNFLRSSKTADDPAHQPVVGDHGRRCGAWHPARPVSQH